MRHLILYTIVTVNLFLSSCGNGKDLSENPATGKYDKTEMSPLNDTLTTAAGEQKNEKSSKKKYQGIIRDKTNEEGCSFVIETNIGDGLILLDPAHLEEKYKKDGLPISFTFSRTERPGYCTIAELVLLNSIAVRK